MDLFFLFWSYLFIENYTVTLWFLFNHGFYGFFQSVPTNGHKFQPRTCPISDETGSDSNSFRGDSSNSGNSPNESDVSRSGNISGGNGYYNGNSGNGENPPNPSSSNSESNFPSGFYSVSYDDIDDNQVWFRCSDGYVRPVTKDMVSQSLNLLKLLGGIERVLKNTKEQGYKVHFNLFPKKKRGLPTLFVYRSILLNLGTSDVEILKEFERHLKMTVLEFDSNKVIFRFHPVTLPQFNVTCTEEEFQRYDYGESVLSKFKLQKRLTTEMEEEKQIRREKKREIEQKRYKEHKDDFHQRYQEEKGCCSLASTYNDLVWPLLGCTGLGRRHGLM